MQHWLHPGLHAAQSSQLQPSARPTEGSSLTLYVLPLYVQSSGQWVKTAAGPLVVHLGTMSLSGILYRNRFENKSP